MELTLNTIFILNLSFLLLHEMDAIRNKEWKMFIYLKNMEDDKAYQIFTVMHLPIYVVMLFVLVNYFSNLELMIYLILDLFLIFHSIIHYIFKRHSENNFNSSFSKIIIYSMGVASVIHLCGLIVR
ncbi:DUF6713 family protein [Clostridium formicaceticum]|uniref:Uncharacterized protein n=1 Tax=Clostridium formicaceticum TaxID=1497 RepID=A0AAC9WGP2_9CLOT|nr:DUF6713 family protein [Clostridium formicaceticum]AOY77588.1 hypothetical protein BJL90_18035 [Clostridium formicaceticum]ARE88167.1 hypothetical protein CLFO_25680 [Clostridium formicaceticum]